jgi:IclR family acetate operon transcriptional repressor
MEVGQETANLASLDRNSAVYVESVQAPRIVRMCPELGKRLPLHSTAVGKVLLAHQPDELVRNVVRGAPLAATTPNTIMDLGRLSEELKRVRQTGYAVDLEEHEEGVRCLAAPVFSPDGRILAAMSLSGPASRLGSERLEVLIPHIKSIAATFSLSLDPFV